MCQRNVFDLQLADGSTISIVGKTALNEWLAQGHEFVEMTKRLVIEPVENVLHIAKQSIDGMMSKFGVTSKKDVEVYLTGSNNFRIERATILPYKGNRSPFDRPVHLQAVKDYLVDRWGAVITDGEEADDAIGKRMTTQLDGVRFVACSNDKDMRMIPGWHYDWPKGELVEVSEIDGWRNFFTQMLVGDRTDNIPGLEGVGLAKAAAILKGYTKPETMWCGVFQAYFNRYELRYNDKLSLKEALQEIADLLWIKRTGMERWIVPE